MFGIPDPAAASFCGCSGRALQAKLRLLRQYGSALANPRARELAIRLSDRARQHRAARFDPRLEKLQLIGRESAAAHSAHASDLARAASRRLFY
jgi:hypothetical protein